jgi:hypothetical protein
MSNELIAELQAHFKRLRRISMEQDVMKTISLILNCMIFVRLINSPLCMPLIMVNLIAFLLCLRSYTKECDSINARLEEVAEQRITGQYSTQEKVRMLTEELVKELKTR